MIADRIRELREAANITQAELARQLGITRNGVNSWEQGFSTPSPASIVELALFFHVTTDYILGLEGHSAINVDGLSDRDVALLAELAGRLKKQAE